jgi:FixJ family two-component response regulator
MVTACSLRFFTGNRRQCKMNSARVYVIDDDTSVRKGLTRLLRSADHQTQVFESASEFLARPTHAGPVA